MGLSAGGWGVPPYETDGNARRSLRGVNFGFWSRLGCSGHSANISRQETQKQKSDFLFNLLSFSICLF